MSVSPGIEHEERFRQVYSANFPALLAYALRRVEQPPDAADVVAETFLIAWRRADEMPAGDETRLWLYGVARRVLANHHRGGVRRARLGELLRQRLTPSDGGDPGTEVPERLAVRAALDRLSPLDREVISLILWEGLQPREAATVLRVSPETVRTRLSRARARMRDLLGHDRRTAGHVLDVLTVPTPEEA